MSGISSILFFFLIISIFFSVGTISFRSKSARGSTPKASAILSMEKIQLKDLILIDDIHFIDIPESKSENGVRVVPLHDFVYKELTAYAKKNNKTDYIFRPGGAVMNGSIYRKAAQELAKYAGYSLEDIKVVG